MSKTISLHTLGCKLNVSETSALADGAIRNGFKLVPFGMPSDVVVVNTCSVTDSANQKCRNIIRRALRKSPHSYVIVTGCYAQLEPDEIQDIEGVDMILGAKEKFSLSKHLTSNDLKKRKNAKVLVGNIATATDFDYGHSLAIAQTKDRTRAYLKVQDGCDYNCSYCTIPLARGKSRNPAVVDIVGKAKLLLRSGYQEIVLTGVNIGAFKSEKGERFIDLLLALNRLPVKRIRISSIEPNLLTSDVINIIAESEKIVPHVHVPLQSGCDKILRAMKRRYHTDLYEKKMLELSQKVEHVCIGADVIVGYVGELEEDFIATYRFIERMPITYLHVFPFSLRPRTDAYKWKGSACLPLPQEVKMRRKKLEQLSYIKQKRFNGRFLNTSKDVLFEEPFLSDSNVSLKDGMLYGYTDNYIRVSITLPSLKESEENIFGKIRCVHLKGMDESLNVVGDIV